MTEKVLNKDLARGIMSALVFYDIFDYPLTLLEIWKFFQSTKSFSDGKIHSMGEIAAVLGGDEFLQNWVTQKLGFYMLRGREDLAEMRLGRHNQAQRRWRKAVRLIGWLGDVPFLQMVAMCNMFSVDTPSPRSDIDIVVVARHGRIWLVRLLVTILIALTGQWRHRRVAGKICLSFFLTDKHLDLQKLYRQKGVWQETDPYLYNWVALVAPVYDRGKTAEKFWVANNWVKKYIPNCFLYQSVGSRRVHPGPIARAWRGFWEFVWRGRAGDWLERVVRWWQTEYMKARGDQTWLQNPNVVRSDEVLKFHEQDRRDHFRREFERRMKMLAT
jgi:hypothetical protein